MRNRVGLLQAAARVLWKLKKAYSLGIPKKKLARGKSQTEEEHAYGRRVHNMSVQMEGFFGPDQLS